MVRRATEFGADPIDIQVGARLRTLRRQRDMSQGALGRAMGISFQQVQKYERGTNRISASMLVRAARTLDVQPSQLLPDESEQAAKPGDLARLLRLLSTRGAEELVQNYANIAFPRVRRALLQFAHGLASPEPANDDREAA